MKPPHNSRSGGSSRPPSDRAPFRGSGGHSNRSSEAGAPRDGQRSRNEGYRSDAPRHGKSSGPHGGGGHGGGGYGGGRHGGGGGGGQNRPPREGGQRFGGEARHEGAQAEGARQPRPRQDRPHHDHERHEGARPERARHEGARPEGLRHEGPRHEGSRHEGARAGGGRHGAPRPGTAEAPKGTVWLYGHHAVAAALANPARRLRRLLVTEEGEAAITKQLPGPWAIPPEHVERARLDQLLGRDIVHQGAALLADHLAPPSLQSVLERRGPLVVLDQVTDPRNIGAIMRSAAAFGAAAVIVQDRNAPEETGALAKAASGALETMPLLRAVNIARTIIALKAANVWCVGLDASGKPLSGPAFADRRVALVLGAEGEGLRRLTRETCDELAGLSMQGDMESLNVSAAGAIALYEITRR